MEAVRSYPSTNCGLPRISAGSAPALIFSRPAQRSLTLRPTCLPSRLCDPLHRRLQRLRCLYRCSDCYRVERTSSRVGLTPTVVHTPLHGALKKTIWLIFCDFNFDPECIPILRRSLIEHPGEKFLGAQLIRLSKIDSFTRSRRDWYFGKAGVCWGSNVSSSCSRSVTIVSLPALSHQAAK